MITEFVDRIKEVEEVCRSIDENNRLLIVYGESGVGKTSLLRKAVRDLRQLSLPVIAFIVDFNSFASELSPMAALVNGIVENSAGVLGEDIWHNPEQGAGEIVDRLSRIDTWFFLYKKISGLMSF